MSSNEGEKSGSPHPMYIHTCSLRTWLCWTWGVDLARRAAPGREQAPLPARRMNNLPLTPFILPFQVEGLTPSVLLGSSSLNGLSKLHKIIPSRKCRAWSVDSIIKLGQRAATGTEREESTGVNVHGKEQAICSYCYCCHCCWVREQAAEGSQ